MDHLSRVQVSCHSEIESKIVQSVNILQECVFLTSTGCQLDDLLHVIKILVHILTCELPRNSFVNQQVLWQFPSESGSAVTNWTRVKRISLVLFLKYVLFII